MRKKFDHLVEKILKEDMNISGPGGVYGSPGEEGQWNPGDNRIAQGLGIVTRFGKKKSKKKKKKK